MATLTAYSPNNDGRFYCSGASYSTARTGGSGTASADVRPGQYYAAGSYYVFEAFISFDTSSIPDTATISSVVLSGYLTGDNSGTDFTVQARIHTWTDPISSNDWVAGADLSSETLVATLATNGIGATGAYKAFTSEAGFVGNISKTGTTYLLLCSSDTVDNTAPTGTEHYVTFNSGGSAPNAFKLVVEYTDVVYGSADGSAVLLAERTGDATGGARLAAQGTGDVTGSAVLAVYRTCTVVESRAFLVIAKYSSALTGLSPGQTTFIRAYAISSAGTAYGDEVLAYTWAQGGAVLRLVDNGVCTGSAWLSNPLAQEDCTGSAELVPVGGWVSHIENIEEGTHYYVRAYATSDAGTGYGSEEEFDTAAISDTDAEGSAYLQATRTTDGSGSADLLSAGSYASSLTGLSPSTHYYVRAYATSSEGTGYGGALEFDTLGATTGDVTGSAELLATGGYLSFLTELEPSTTYYVRAYATSTDGTGYGDEEEFITLGAGTANGSAVLDLIGFITGSASLQMAPGTRLFKGLMGGLFHAKRFAGSTKTISGSAWLRQGTLLDRTGSAELIDIGEYTRLATGSAVLEAPWVVFRGLMGLLLHARRTGLRLGTTTGSAHLGLVPQGYVYGSAILRRRRTGDAGGSGETFVEPIRGWSRDGSGHLQGAATSAGGDTGSAYLAIPVSGDAEGDALLVALTYGSATGSAALIPQSDGSVTGSAWMARGHWQDGRGSAMLRTIRKGRTTHTHRRQIVQATRSSGKVAHMKRKDLP